ncbi:MAG: DUF11 domain-containing protein, partial [Candidatus Eisenbacteria bacterium]
MIRRWWWLGLAVALLTPAHARGATGHGPSSRAALRPDHARPATASGAQLLSDLGLGMTVSNPKPNEGATVSFTITLSNAGPDTATGVAVTDLLPAGLLNQSATASQGS